MCGAIIFALVLAFLPTSVHSGQADPSQKTWERTLEAAKKEGRVVVGGPPGTGYRDAVEKFQAAFPDIRLEYVSLAAAQFDARLTREREAGQFLWDVILWGFTGSIFRQYVPAGWFEPIRPAIVLPEILEDSKWLGGFDSGFMDKTKQFAYAFSLNASGSMYVNYDLIPETALRNVEDALNPRWKGKIAWFDPRVPNVGALMLALIRKVLGDDGAKKLLIDQEPGFTVDQRQLIEWIVRGRYSITIGGGTRELARFQKENLGLNVKRFLFPIDATTPAYGGAFLMNHAPHPNAARVFLNWLLSQKGQSHWANLGVTNSRRLDVAAGEPATAVDPQRLDRYINFNSEEHIGFFSDAIRFARSVLK